MIRKAIAKLQKNPKLQRVYAGKYRGSTRHVEATADPQTVHVVTVDQKVPILKLRTTLVDGSPPINESHTPLEQWVPWGVIDNGEYNWNYTLFYGRDDDGILYGRARVAIGNAGRHVFHEDSFYRIFYPHPISIPICDLLSKEYTPCDFNGIPAKRKCYPNGTVRRLVHHNAQGEIHRGGTDPAIVTFRFNGDIRTEIYVQHNRYFREGGLPSYAFYAEGTDVAIVQHHWTHDYGDEPPLAPLLSLADAGLTGACAICFDGAQHDAGACLPICHHTFHRECIAEWLAKQRTCPICRIEIH